MFISQEQAERASKWIREHPEEAKKFNEWHRMMFDKLMAKEITLEDFIKQHEMKRNELPK